MNANIKGSDRVAVAAALVADSHAVGVHSTGWVDMAAFETLLAVAICGAFAGTAQLSLEQAAAADGTGAKAVDGRVAVDLVAANPAMINLSAPELDVNNGYRYVRAVLTVAGGAADVGVVVQGLDARYQPA